MIGLNNFETGYQRNIDQAFEDTIQTNKANIDDYLNM